MDTSGHTELSLVGEKILKPALERANHKGMRIQAFYLGNWLTDVSQCIDARAYKGFKLKAQNWRASLQKTFDRFLDDVPSWIPSYFVPVTQELVATLRKQVDEHGELLRQQIDAILAEGSNGKLAETFRFIFRYKGYFKFVAAEDGSVTNARMDPKAYFDVFNNRYGEYFPVEHLDRPETTPDHYDTRTGTPPQNKYTKVKAGGPSVYTYLREDTKVAAGILAYLDGGVAADPPKLSWAAASFHPNYTEFTDQNGKQQKVDDTNYEWNRHLALLGHALHAIEDFFAHSNFVEHAASGTGKSAGLPSSYRRFQRLEDQETLVRRLKKWSPGCDAKKLNDVPNEPDVVTGYFDMVDTIVSLAHVVEELKGVERKKVGLTLDEALEYKYSKLLADTVELYNDPKKVWADPKNDPEEHGYDEDEGNMAVNILRKKGDKGLKLAEGKDAMLNQVAGVFAGTVFRGAPITVQKDFVDSVKELGRVVGVGMMGYSLYKLLKEIGGFFTDPVKWFGKFLPDYVKELLEKYGAVYLRRFIAHLWGADRVGCHSLIAKDTGPELLHKAAMDCAKAVHWYTVHALVRHSTEKTVAVARGDLSLKTVNNLFQWEWIDWLELLEYFLAHPYATAGVTTGSRVVPTSIIHITRKDHSSMSPDTLGSLAKEYSKTFVAVPGGPPHLTWEVIADANFPTAGMTTERRQKQINAVLKHQRTGLKVSDGVNYAFRPGLEIVIPYQGTQMPVIEVPEGVRLWWYPVIVDDWKKITEVYDEGKPSPKAGKVGHQWLSVPHKEVLQLVDEGDQLRKKLEQAYKQ